MKLGQFVFDEKSEARGLFCGYDPNGNKVLINGFDLQDLLANNHMDYKVSVKIDKVSSPLNLTSVITKFLIPDSFKKKLISDLQNSENML